MSDFTENLEKEQFPAALRSSNWFKKMLLLWIILQSQFLKEDVWVTDENHYMRSQDKNQTLWIEFHIPNVVVPNRIFEPDSKYKPSAVL